MLLFVVLKLSDTGDERTNWKSKNEWEQSSRTWWRHCDVLINLGRQAGLRLIDQHFTTLLLLSRSLLVAPGYGSSENILSPSLELSFWYAYVVLAVQRLC